MPVKLEDRPIETVKEEVIDILVHNYSHGYISGEAFERRLDAVIESGSAVVMMKQIEDLDQTPDEAIKATKDHQLGINYTDNVVEDTTNLVSILGGSDLRGQWEVPKTIRVFTFMGGSNIDFTDARFSSSKVTVKLINIMGGTDINVPEGVNVVSKAFCILGGVDNKAPSIASKQAPTIVIEGFVLMGGLDISIRTSIKEKFIAFANQMKAMFDTKSNIR